MNASKSRWIALGLISLGVLRADDPAQRMVDGIGAWLKRETAASVAHRHPTRERLRYIIGAVDNRVTFEEPELTKLRENIYAIRWPVLDGVHGEGLLYKPAPERDRREALIALPDAGQSPEDLTGPPRWAAEGKWVLVPVLIDRRDTWSGNPTIGKWTNQPHREFIYRMAYEVGRHIIGYEVEKVLAAVDWLGKSNRSVAVRGYGEGGLIALYAAALDPRIESAAISGYFGPREELWQEPIYRSAWSLLRDFGDAELATLCRKVIVDATPGPTASGPDTSDPKRRGAAPGALAPIPEADVRREFDRARRMGAHIEWAASTTSDPATLTNPGRMHRQFTELVDYTQKLVRDSARVRSEWWEKTDEKTRRERVRDDLIGHLPAPTLAMNPRLKPSYHGEKWDGYEVTLDLWPDVFAYGVLLKPKDIRPGERRPVVVVQHGLNGRAQDMFGQPENSSPFHYYQNIGSKLADMGFVVYAPQNPYIGDFRYLVRLANPLQLSIYSFIVAQNERLLDWLGTLPYVDAKRIGFYGLSYGGKVALRIPALVDRYALSICSGDFNEWVVKVSAVDFPWSYMYTQEYDMPEFNMAGIANHAELAMLIAPRPFMVERGHRDGVGVDEWVAYEFAKVRRYYDEAGIGNRARIEFFNGPHMIHGVGTVEFLKQLLAKP
jgi:dienelactone hydrolase